MVTLGGDLGGVALISAEDKMSSWLARWRWRFGIDVLSDDADLPGAEFPGADGTTFFVHREPPGNAFGACPARTDMRRRLRE